VDAGTVSLEGNFDLPDSPKGFVLFAHGSGSSRHSTRNRFVAGELQEHGLGTLLIDLLTAEEEEIDRITAEFRFDIPLLARRLVGATQWLLQNPEMENLRIGYFGASTGAGAAMIAAAELEQTIGAIVSRGGRPDLAGEHLARVHSPTLLIVGGRDYPVISMNRSALDRIPAEKRLEIIPGATHLFEEKGALEKAALLAAEWFVKYLDTSPPLEHDVEFAPRAGD
jgi:dienelactone hydrolase